MNANFGLLILPIIILVSPIVLTIAANQKKEIKQNIRRIFQISLLFVLSLSFLNWETMRGGDRNAIQLAKDFQNIYLWIFLIINLVQIIVLQKSSRREDLLASILNITNTFFFFAATITISNKLGKSIVSPAVITAAMMVLINNVLGLVLANKDPKLLEKYPFSTQR